MELTEAMMHMRRCMEVTHPLLADELQNVLIDKDMDPADHDTSPEVLMQHLAQSQCFQSECTWVRASD